MRWLILTVAPLAALAVLVACSLGSHQSYVPVTGGSCSTCVTSDTATRRQASAPGYLYVADHSAHLLVYTAGRKPSLIRTVSLPVPAVSLAVDSQGKVYASLWGTSQIDVFAPGAMKRDRVISDGIEHPFGLSVDENDNLLVGNNSSTGAFVGRYHPGDNRRSAIMPIPAPYAVQSVAADRNGNVYAAVYNSPYNFVAEWVNGQWQNLYFGGAGPSSIVFDAQGSLEVTAAHSLESFEPPYWHRDKPTELGAGYTARWSSRGQDGTVYVPVDGPNPYVLVIPARSAIAPWKIDLGNIQPNSVTAGN